MDDFNINVPQAVIDLFQQIDTSLRETDRFTLPPHLDRYVDQYIKYSMAHRTADLNQDSRMFRARIHSPNQTNPYAASEIGSPPADKATTGRLNPQGISYLYLANSIETAVAEVRPWRSAIISIACFTPKKILQVASLTSPYPTIESGVISEHGVGLLAGLIIESLYFSIPAHREDKLAYLSTQYIASKFKKAGIDGSQYESVLRDGGINSVFFDPSSCQCNSIEVVEVVGVNYEHERHPASPRHSRNQMGSSDPIADDHR